MGKYEKNYVRTETRKQKLLSVLRQRQPDLTLILDNIHDPHNVSAIYRSCDAFGVSEVNLCYTDTPFPELAKKTSASARKWVETRRHSSADAIINELLKKDYQILATSFNKNARPLRRWNFLRPTAIILGNEHRGVREELLKKATGELYIPMHGLIQSFNVSVAAAIILAEAARQREDAGWYDYSRTKQEELEKKYNQWLQK